MEEQKKNKEVKMNVVADNSNTQKEQKYTYEQLNSICGKLFQENQQLKKHLQEAAETFNQFSILDYQFKVLELYYNNKNNLITFSNECIENCISNIENSLKVNKKEETVKQ